MCPGFHGGRASLARRAFGEQENEELQRLADLLRRGGDADLHGTPLEDQRILLELVELEHLDELEADGSAAEVEAPRFADQRALRRRDRLIGRGRVAGGQEGD